MPCRTLKKKSCWFDVRLGSDFVSRPAWKQSIKASQHHFLETWPSRIYTSNHFDIPLKCSQPFMESQLSFFFLTIFDLIKHWEWLYHFWNGILLPKLFCCEQWTVRKKCSSDREKLLKFKAECREFAEISRSLQQFIWTVKGQNNVWYQDAFLTCSWRLLR